MPHVIDYIAWRGDIPFSGAGLNEVDNLIFCLLSYVDLDGIVSSNPAEGITVREAAKEYFFTHDPKEQRPLGLIVPGEICDLFRAMANAPRYRDLILSGYINEISEEREMQFSVLTIHLSGGGYYVAFRGTDDTIVGWKEDFNLSWMDEVPAQRKAVEYLNDLKLPAGADLYVGGHSKGGNLAIWGAVHASPEVRKRLVRVYSNDGPGFSEAMLNTEAYRSLSDRIVTLVPRSSLVGLMLDHDEFDIIRSSRLGIFQHNGLSWEVLGGQFVRDKQLSSRGRRNDTVIRERITHMSRDEKRVFTKLFFGILESTGARTLTELNQGSIRNVVTMLRTVNDMDKDTKELAMYLISRLFNTRPLAPKRTPGRQICIEFRWKKETDAASHTADRLL